MHFSWPLVQSFGKSPPAINIWKIFQHPLLFHPPPSPTPPSISEQRVEMQEVVDASMIEVCAEEGVSPEQVFFILLFICCFLYHNGYSGKKSKHEY